MAIRIKIIFVVIAFFLTFSSVEAGSLSKPANNLGLVGYWSFNEATSTVATDFSGNGNHGTLNTFSEPATVSSGWTIGKFGSGLIYDGSSDYVQVGQDIFDSLNVGTISAWIKFDVDPGTGTAQIIFGGASSSSAINFFVFRIYGVSASDTRLSVGSRIADDFMYGDTQIEPGKWYHVAVSSDGATYKMYVNGVAQSITVEFGTNSGAWFADNVSGTDNYSIGVLRRSSGNIEYFNGSIDEVRVYNRELSASEVLALYQSGLVKINSSQKNVVTRSLVGYWTFDGPDVLGSVVYDRSSNGTLGSISGTSRTLGKLGQALYFDGSNDRVDTNYRWSSSDTSITISQWIKSTATAYSNIVANYNGSASDIETLIENGNYKSFIRGTNSANVNPSSTATVNDGQWHHVVTVVSGTTATQYVDGVLDGTDNDNFLNGNYDSGADIFIGEDALGANDFNGSIDDVRIYNRALTLAEIKTLYNMGGSKINTSSASPSGTTLGSGLVGYWSFNGPDFTDRIYDRSGQGNHGYMVNMSTTTAKTIGRTGQALSFDGTDDHVQIFDAANHTAYTFSMWIKPATVSAQNIWVRTNSTGPAFAWSHQIRINSSGILEHYVFGGTPSLTVGTTVLSPNTWYHIVGTAVNGDSFKIYVNGVLEGTPSSLGSMWSFGDRYFLGSDSSGFGYFNGVVDEIRNYSRALTDAEIKMLYNMGR